MTAGEMTTRVETVANHAWLLLVARFSAAIGVPVALLVLGYAASGFMDLRDNVRDMAAVLRWSIEPRLTATEAAVSGLKAEEGRRASDRFSRSDAREMEQTLRRDLSRVEAQVAELRDRFEALERAGGVK